MTQKKFTLLLVDDDPSVISSLKRIFFEDDYQLLSATNGRQALEVLAARRVDAALVDLKMPEMDGFSLLRHINEDFPATRVIMITGHGGVEIAVQAIRSGAFDFFEKPFCPEVVRQRVSQLHEAWYLNAENQRLRKFRRDLVFEGMIGDSPPMNDLKELIVRIGPGDAPVLIIGETGTGKELVARALHRQSQRSDNPFVPVDCGALNESVVESELFGHCRGAFTGATYDRPGLFRAAHQGTLFLDEVGELSLAMQVKLLRSLQEGQVRPVGGQQSLPVDVRIVAATNRDLPTEVAAGRFREDLYYRLQVFTLNITPLRNRVSDIPLLVAAFIKKFSDDRTEIVEADSFALSRMQGYPWPGNVRELENTVRRALALGHHRLLLAEDLPPQINEHGSGHRGPEISSSDSLAAYEIMAISNALRKSSGNRRQAAGLLAIGEATLYRKLKKYGLDRR